MCRELFTVTSNAEGKQACEHVISFFSGIANAQSGENPFEMSEHAQGVLPNIIDMWQRLRDTLHYRKFRHEIRKNSQHFQRTDGCIGFWSLKDLEQLIALTFR